MTQLCLPGNALTPHVLEGTRFSAGAIYNGVGTMKDRGGQEVSVPSVYMQEGYLSVSPSDIPAGTWNAIDSGTEFVYRDALHVSAKNILMGVEMLGLDGTATSDATATAADIATGKIAYSNGQKLTGTYAPKSPYKELKLTSGGTSFNVPNQIGDNENEIFVTIDMTALGFRPKIITTTYSLTVDYAGNTIWSDVGIYSNFPNGGYANCQLSMNPAGAANTKLTMLRVPYANVTDFKFPVGRANQEYTLKIYG